MKLNLGSGRAKIEGYINLDISAECEPDIVHDFRKGLPYPKETFDEIVMLHTIEHIEKKFHENPKLLELLLIGCVCMKLFFNLVYFNNLYLQVKASMVGLNFTKLANTSVFQKDLYFS